MPLYKYHCSCGADFDRLLPIDRRNDVLCSCGRKPQLEISAPAICMAAKSFKVFANDGTVLHQSQTTKKSPPPVYRWDNPNVVEV